jgi:hypothetical protein
LDALPDSLLIASELAHAVKRFVDESLGFGEA